MSDQLSRREFIKTAAIGSAGIMAVPLTGNAFLGSFNDSTDLYDISGKLILTWADALLKLQVTNQQQADNYGGIYCSYDKTVHGRVGDTIYPLLYLAGKTNDQKYLDAARLLYRWMERRVSQPDGSWLNEPVAGSWKGTTVFSAIALAEALKNHGALMDTQWKTAITNRLVKAGDFIHQNFKMDYGNINYPVTAAYGLSLLGDVLDITRFKTRGTELAKLSLNFFTGNNKLLFGEGDIDNASKRGLYAIDLGYNVEESLPALAMYGLLRNDEEVLATITESLQWHLEFMLPDGGWDNSWGTRNYKWTYWGSRTSDGCQTAYALLAHRNPVFYKAAVRNTQLMQQCTVNGLLQGGLHNADWHITPCVHHTFSHIKALTTVLDYRRDKLTYNINKLTLPREKKYLSKTIQDLNVVLIAEGNYKATITGYDKEYKKYKNGHPAGGALSMLWHQHTGPVLCGSMNEYQLYEAGNMQADPDHAMSLTPRIELQDGDNLYTNITCLDTIIHVSHVKSGTFVSTKSILVDKNQQHPAEGQVDCEVAYHFIKGKVYLIFKCSHPQARIIVPVISKTGEALQQTGKNLLTVHKPNAQVIISANTDMNINARIFNYVPGLEAIPIILTGDHVEVAINVIR